MRCDRCGIQKWEKCRDDNVGVDIIRNADKHGECTLSPPKPGGCAWRDVTQWKTGATACEGWWNDSPVWTPERWIGKIPAGPRCILSDEVKGQRDAVGQPVSAVEEADRPDEMPTVDDTIDELCDDDGSDAIERGFAEDGEEE